jgi:hypothetical protein
VALKQVIEIYELLDGADVSGGTVRDYLKDHGASAVTCTRVAGDLGSTDFVTVTVPGLSGTSEGGPSPTLEVIGRLGGIGARPNVTGLVSDGDGAIVALSVAAKLLDMATRGDRLQGDVVVATHICASAPVHPRDPVCFMGSPVDMITLNNMEVDPSAKAILSVDTTKGNRIINRRGFAISPTVKDGYILRVSESLISIMEMVTGRPASVFAITTQDITPYGNDLYHLNSILQPATATSAPVVGVAITTQTCVPGCATGASHAIDMEVAARFCIEVAKGFGPGTCSFYDSDEFDRIVHLYGSMTHLKTIGRQKGKHGNVNPATRLASACTMS